MIPGGRAIRAGTSAMLCIDPRQERVVFRALLGRENSFGLLDGALKRAAPLRVQRVDVLGISVKDLVVCAAVFRVHQARYRLIALAAKLSALIVVGVHFRAYGARPDLIELRLLFC